MESPLERLARPLRFAARNDFQNLGVLRELEGFLGEAIRGAQAEVAPGSEEARALAVIAPLVAGIDAVDDGQRVDRVRKILAAIDGGAARREADDHEEPAPARKKARRRAAARSADTAAGLALLPLSAVSGIGPKTLERLEARGLHTVLDALLFLPRAVEDRRTISKIADLAPGHHAVVKGRVEKAGLVHTGRRPLFEVMISDGTGSLSCRWFHFHARGMTDRFAKPGELIVSGTVTAFGAQRQMVHPEIETAAPGGHHTGALVPIYPAVEGVPEKALRKILQSLAERFAERVADPLPLEIRGRHKLPALPRAILRAHVPDASETGSGATDAVLRRLVFDELFYFQLAMGRRGRAVERAAGLSHAPGEPWQAIARAMLPFDLTRAQERVLAEISEDLAAPHPMNRLLQGDVGSGKTAVAMIAAAIVGSARRQTALLAPTEILAEQHHATSERFLARRGLRHALLTGSTRAKARREILEALARSEIDVLIGTHALLEPDVVFGSLGLAIVDEQHRFGVAQRAALRAKAGGTPPDVLVMTATPIPRTLAMTAYGDLEVSVIDERPPGRTPVRTKVIRERDRPWAHGVIERALNAGRQAYVIVPLVEAPAESADAPVEDLLAATEAQVELAARLPAAKVGLLHGRMRPDEKSAVMEEFRKGAIHVLVATTVVEVGVDVPNATLIVIEHAERFGLSQLHQLRGRVGRGEHAGLCLLVAMSAGEEAWQRLAVLERTNDGFEIAEADLAIRGPGELLGTRQSGVLFELADLVRDRAVLEVARREAFALLEEDPDLAAPEHAALEAELKRRLGHKIDLADVG